jgi:murein DD-endopeptidase MepM/ murein hydrolase activator NlpD
MDMRDFGNGFDTTDAAAAARGAPRPEPDDRGIISYPTYQVAVARAGDTVSTVAARVGLPPTEVASYNGLPETTALRPGELVALPRRVGGTAVPGEVTTTPLGAPGDVRVAGLAAPAIDRAEAQQQAAGDEPRRHRVATGETAFSIARRYGVSVDALADWNGLGEDRAVRDGQFLLIPPAAGTATVAETERPGQGSTAPVPPSATEPLPQEDVAREVETPAAPDMSASETTASDTAKLLTPVAGASSIVRPYRKGRNDGIDIAASPGAAVRAADAGTVAAITRDTDGVPIVVVRHQGDLLTVYAGVDDLRVEKGQQVTRGQQIAAIRAADPAILHFEVRQGFDSVDPAPFLN